MKKKGAASNMRESSLSIGGFCTDTSYLFWDEKCFTHLRESCGLITI
jgi:hypothetical protein